jgi:hypothetical protein
MNRISKIKRAIMLIIIGTILSGGTMAQNTPQQKENIEARHIGFITNELQLTPQEAQTFWPVYNHYHGELETLRKKHTTDLLAAKVNFDSFTDVQVSKLIDDEMDYRQKELDLQRRYSAEFKKVLPVKKVARFYRAEQQFKINLIRDTKQNNPGQQPR